MVKKIYLPDWPMVTPDEAFGGLDGLDTTTVPGATPVCHVCGAKATWGTADGGGVITNSCEEHVGPRCPKWYHGDTCPEFHGPPEQEQCTLPEHHWGMHTSPRFGEWP